MRLIQKTTQGGTREYELRYSKDAAGLLWTSVSIVNLNGKVRTQVGRFSFAARDVLDLSESASEIVGVVSDALRMSEREHDADETFGELEEK